MANGSIRIDVDTSGASQNVRKLVEDFNKLQKPLPTASANLAKLVDDAKEAGKSLTTAGKDSVALATALGKVNTAAKSPRQAFSQLKQSLEEATVAYNKLSDQEKAGEFGKALKKSIEEIAGKARELKKSLGDANKSLQEHKTESKSTGGVLDALEKKLGFSVSSFKKFAGAGAAAAAAVKVAKDAFMQSESNIDEWGRTVEGAKGAYNTFLDTINNGDWSSFFDNLANAIEGSRELYNKLDRLSSIKNNNQVAIALAQQALAKARVELQEAQTKGDKAEAKRIQETITAQEKRLAALRRQESDAAKDSGQLSIVNQLMSGANSTLGGAINKNTAEYIVQKLMSGGQSAIDMYTRNYRRLQQKGTTEKREESYITATGQTNYRTVGGGFDLTRLSKTEQVQYAVSKAIAERESAFKEGLELYRQGVDLETSIFQDTFKYNRWAGKGGTGGKTKTEAVFDENASTLKGFQDNIAALTKTLSGLTVGSQQYMDTLKQLNEWQIIQKRQTTYNSDMQNVWNGNFGKGVSIGTQFSKLPSDDDLKKAAVVKLPKELTEWFKEEKKASKADGIGKMAQGMEGVIGGLENLGIELPSGLKEVVGGLNSIIGIITSISTILESIEIIQAATAWLPFKNGGPVHAASGIVMGKNYLDRVPATLSSGEMVMNEADQSALWKAIKSGDFGGGGTATSIVRAEDIILAVNNHGMRTGKGKLAFVKG